MIKYHINLDRNKGPRSHSNMKTKQDLIKEKGMKCYICEKIFHHASWLHLEHKIPVLLCGKIFHRANLDLVCIRCDNRKTKIDKAIMAGFKDLKLISKDRSYIECFIHPEELAKEYLKFFNHLKDFELTEATDSFIKETYQGNRQVS